MKLIVSQEMSGLRLDKFLTYHGFSRNRAKMIIEQNAVQIANMHNPKCSTKVFANLEILVEDILCNTTVPYVDIPIQYEDEELLIIEKPAGVLSHPGEVSVETRPSVTNFLLSKYTTLPIVDGEHRPGIVHRLDQNTSGLMVIAKSIEAYIALKKMMMDRKIVKKYVALVYGTPSPAKGIIRNFIQHNRSNYKKMLINRYPTATGKEAVTSYRTLRSWDYFSLVECTLHTGRTHQIRAHMSNIGCGIVGDGLYGRNRSIKQSLAPQHVEAIKTFNRYALHANIISFTHPIHGNSLTITSDIPPSMAELIKALSSE